MQLVIILMLASSVSCTGASYLPGFEGVLLDKESGRPIENAYVVCFTDYYSILERINVGGGNAHPDALQIAITDNKGFFKIDAYMKYTGGWTEERRVYVFKEGYIYAVQYVQIAERKDVLRKSNDILSPSEEIPLNAPIRIYLSSKESNNIDGSPLINGYLGLLYSTYRYHDYFKYSNKTAYKRLKPFFLEVYKIVDKYSDEIQKTFPEPYIVQNWNNDLARYREDLRDDLHRDGGR